MIRTSSRYLQYRFCSLLLSAPVALVSPVSAEDLLGQQGDWQIGADTGAVSSDRKTCVIMSTNKIEGGRRERPRIRITLADRTMVFDPDRSLAAVITGIAALEDRSDRFQPRRVLQHQLRIDNGNVISATQQDPRYGDWEASRDIGEFDSFIENMQRGKVLRYEWQIDRAGKNYEYDLAGFKSMLKIVEQDPTCQSADQ